ncbi:MAG TPA: hypothetical protein VJY12_00250, partial [Dysgonamonadaceae bacterium]|nr:hypothetical protein [Dysgonamonadaceae bacterium]
MATVNLTNPQEEIITGNDNIVIIDNFQSIRGGRSLNVDGYPHDVIHAGHVIIKSTEGEYKPMPLGGEGDIVSLGTIVGGSGYTDGTYKDVPLTGGTGTGAEATIEVEDGAVTSVTITKDGKGYAVEDELSATAAKVGGTGSGFKVPVKTVSTVKDEYASLPEGHTYAGILIASIPTSRPFAGIMVRGTVNVNASPFPLTDILDDVKAALPLIVFTNDKA